MMNTQTEAPAWRHASEIAFENFSAIPDEARIRVGTVAAVLGVSIPTVWRWTRQGLLPKPERRGNTTRWMAGEIRHKRTGE